MKRLSDPCENCWNIRDHGETALPDPLQEDAILSASRSAFRRFSLLSSVSLFALATTLTALPVEFDTQTLTPTVSMALAEGGEGGDSDGDGGEDGDDGGEGGEGGDNDGGEGGEGDEAGDGGEGDEAGDDEAGDDEAGDDELGGF